MNDNSFYRICLDCNLETKEEVYDYLSYITCKNGHPEKKYDILHQFIEREKAGSPLIDEHVLLPHIESEHVLETQIIIIRPTTPIIWGESTSDLRLIIAILMKSDEQKKVKKKITTFTRSLADEEFISKLINIEKETGFYKELHNLKEEL